MLHRFGANHVLVLARDSALWRVDDQRDLVVLDQIDHVRATFAEAADVLYVNAVGLEELASACGGDDAEAEITESAGDFDGALFVVVFDADENVARVGQCRLRRHL